MAQPRIYFCQFKDSQIEILAEFKNLITAEYCVNLHNNTITGELDNEFWFVNETIKTKTKIIVLSQNKKFPTNDPKFYDKLAPYLKVQKEEKKENKGNAQSRGYQKFYKDKGK